MKPLIRTVTLAAALAGLSAFTVAHNKPVQAEPRTPAVEPTPSPTTPADEPPPVREPVLANPDPQHPAGDLIEVSIHAQRLTAWRNGVVVYRLVISTGRPGYETPAGHYAILNKYENRWSGKWHVWMPWAMRWHDGYFIHQLPHKDGSSYNIGASKLGKPDSHGCVRVNVGDAELLFNWTKIGTPVWVH
jgi:hypothetical protein